MSNQVDKAFVQQFRNNLIHLAQQKGSRLRDTVMSRMVNGKYDHFDRLGAVAAQLRTSRHGDTPQIDTPHSRRRVSLNDYEWADLIDRQDDIRMLIDPKSDYARAGANALGRSIDDVIIAAAIGSAASIDSADASSNVAFAAGMIVDKSFAAADSNLTFEKLNEAKRLLTANDIDDEPLVCVYNSSALHSLLLETEVQSIDTNTVRALVAGEVDTFMGFRFVRTERISGSNGSSTTDPKIALCYAKSAIGLSIGSDVKVEIDKRVDKSYSTQVFASMSIGAVRVEEEKIAQIEMVQA